MKKLLLPLFAVALATSAKADLTITQKIDQEPAGPAGNLTMTMKIKGEKIRVDGMPQMSAIIDLKSGDMTSLIHPQKAVLTIPASALKDLQKQAADANANIETPKATGRKETISGFACEEYETTANGAKVQMWLTKDLPAAEKVMADLSALSPQFDPFKGAMKDKKITGFPMRTVVETPTGAKTTMTVVSLNEDVLADADFAAPSDYQVMQMPTAPGR